MKKYDLSSIMKRAWKNFHKYTKLTFGECLHRAWLSAKAMAINVDRIEKAKEAAGVVEDINTWSAWKELGYEVIHGSSALFGTEANMGIKRRRGNIPGEILWRIPSTENSVK